MKVAQVKKYTHQNKMRFLGLFHEMLTNEKGKISSACVLYRTLIKAIESSVQKKNKEERKEK